MTARTPLQSIRNLLVATAIVATALPCSLRAVELHVDPGGEDANSGSKSAPLKTFAGAQHAVRALRAKAAEPVTVLFHAGTYYLPESILLTSQDSGTKAAPIVYAAAPGEAVAISGGVRLKLGWKPYRNGIMQAAVPADLATDQLFINGQRQTLARYPNFNPDERIFNGYARDAFDPVRAKRWSDPRGGFIHAMHSAMWGDYHYLITGKDADGHVRYEGGWQNNRQMGMHPEYRFVENIFEELDAPGEWFLDTKTHTLYFMPPKGLDLGKAVVEAVRLRQLVEFRGSKTEPVKFVTLRGFAFRHAARTFMDTKEPLLRSDWTIYRGGAILFKGSEDCALEDCLLDQLGGNAVFVSDYNRRTAIRGCQIARAGANGIAFVGDPKAVRNPLFEYGQRQNYAAIDKTPGPKTNNYPADCLVDDCLIYLTGRVEKQTAGVEISMARGITVRHCSIYDVPRAGINIGDGCWGGDLVEFCDVFDTVLETGDHGSFNSWGRDRYWELGGVDVQRIALDPKKKNLPLLDCVEPIVLRNNRWRCDHGWDIDLDDGSSNFRLQNNLCLNGGLKMREGFYRVCENNVTVNNSLHPHVWFRDSQDVVRHNIVFTPYHPIGMPTPWGQECDFNLLHRPNETKAMPATALEKQSGRDEHSIEADAEFIKPSVGDYRVRAGSPALALGFVNFPMDQFGVQSPKLHALAKTPALPAAPESRATAIPPARGADRSAPEKHRDEHVVAWLGAKAKNVVGKGEMSASGLPAEHGIWLVDVPTDSIAASAGVKTRDVILKMNGNPIDSLEDLLRSQSVGAPGAKIELTIWRNQALARAQLTGGGVTYLSPGVAEFVGKGEKPVYDRGKDFLGAWRNSRISLQWKTKLAAAGKQDLYIVLASPLTATDDAYEVVVNDQKLHGIRPRTGSWERFAVLWLGSVSVENQQATVTLRPLGQHGEAVMNLRAIYLIGQPWQ